MAHAIEDGVLSVRTSGEVGAGSGRLFSFEPQEGRRIRFEVGSSRTRIEFNREVDRFEWRVTDITCLPMPIA